MNPAHPDPSIASTNVMASYCSTLAWCVVCKGISFSIIDYFQAKHQQSLFYTELFSHFSDSQTHHDFETKRSIFYSCKHCLPSFRNLSPGLVEAYTRSVGSTSIGVHRRSQAYCGVFDSLTGLEKWPLVLLGWGWYQGSPHHLHSDRHCRFLFYLSESRCRYFGVHGGADPLYQASFTRRVLSGHNRKPSAHGGLCGILWVLLYECLLFLVSTHGHQWYLYRFVDLFYPQVHIPSSHVHGLCHWKNADQLCPIDRHWHDGLFHLWSHRDGEFAPESGNGRILLHHYQQLDVDVLWSCLDTLGSEWILSLYLDIILVIPGSCCQWKDQGFVNTTMKVQFTFIFLLNGIVHVHNLRKQNTRNHSAVTWVSVCMN